MQEEAVWPGLRIDMYRVTFRFYCRMDGNGNCRNPHIGNK